MAKIIKHVALCLMLGLVIGAMLIAAILAIPESKVRASQEYNQTRGAQMHSR